jgi:hypothetical protein
MPGLKAKAILDDCRASYLNDASGAIFTDAKLLPILRTVYSFMQTDLEKNGVQCKYKISPEIRVPTGALTVPNIPGDFMWPVGIQERLWGSSDLYTPMVDRRWTPQVLQTDKLLYYNWNNEQLTLVGATTDRGVLVYYWAAFPAIVDENSTVFGKMDQFLSAALAAMVHQFISQNSELAASCKAIADENRDEIIGIFIKKQKPVRRKPYIPFR